MKRVRLEVDGRPYDVVLEKADQGSTVTVDGVTFRVESVRAGAPGAPIAVRLDNGGHAVLRTHLGAAEVDGDLSTFRVVSVEVGASGRGVGAAGALVRPPMPGKVVAVRVQTGQAVAAGDVLVVLEAMKMQNEVTSPAAGVVVEVRAKAGTTVDAADVLVVLGPPAV